jgi:antibiotic biosynthesis monooxygenase (ABM) superfamily enzyme
VGAITRKLNEASERRPWRTAVLVALALAPVFALGGWLTGPPGDVLAFTVRWVVVAVIATGFTGVFRRRTGASRR